MRFVASSVLRAAPERVFAFHELPDALERLTPSWAGSRVIARDPSIRVGSRSVVSIRCAPLIWVRSELVHTIYDPPHLFEDQQVVGPFRSWRHRHAVERTDEGARLVDTIDYEPPFGAIGRYFAPLVIDRRLQRLFAYRHEVTRNWCEGHQFQT